MAANEARTILITIQVAGSSDQKYIATRCLCISDPALKSRFFLLKFRAMAQYLASETNIQMGAIF